MTTAGVPLSQLKRAIGQVCTCLQEQDVRWPRWESLTEDDLWRELVACILGSRVRFDIAYSAVERMRKADLFSIGLGGVNLDAYEQHVTRVLSEPTEGQGDLRAQGRYPFPKVRARQIRAAADLLYGRGGTIRHRLEQAQDCCEARRDLASHVAGLGPKQASLFLRNIGYATNVAVLDVHVLTYMSWVGLTAAPVSSVRTLGEYETLEAAFIDHSRAWGFPPDRLDLAVWVVVRVVKREHLPCR